VQDKAAKTGLWVQGSFYNSAQDGGSGVLNQEYDADTETISLGFDFVTDDRTVIGISGSYSDINIEQRRSAGDETEINSYQITAYGLRKYGKLQVTGQLGYINGNGDTERTALGETITAGGIDIEGFNIQAEASYSYKLGKTGYFAPVIGLQFADISVDGFTETGGLNLTVGDIDNDYFEGRVGFRVGEQIASPSSVTDLFFSAAILTDFGSGPDNVSLSFGDQSSSISVFDADDERIELGAGVNWYSSQNYSLGASVTGEVSNDFYTVGGQVQFKLNF